MICFKLLMHYNMTTYLTTIYLTSFESVQIFLFSISILLNESEKCQSTFYAQKMADFLYEKR